MPRPPPSNIFFYGSNLLPGQFWWDTTASIAVLPPDFPVELRANPRAFVAEWQGIQSSPVRAFLPGEYRYTQLGEWAVVGMWDTGGGSILQGSCLVFALKGVFDEEAALTLIRTYFSGGLPHLPMPDLPRAPVSPQLVSTTTNGAMFKRPEAGVRSGVPLLMWNQDEPLPNGTPLVLDGNPQRYQKLTTKYEAVVPDFDSNPVRSYTFTLATARSIEIDATVTSTTGPFITYVPAGLTLGLFDSLDNLVDIVSSTPGVAYVNTYLPADTYTVRIWADDGEGGYYGTGTFDIVGFDYGPGVPPVVLPGAPTNPIPIVVDGPEETFVTTISQFPMPPAVRIGCYGVWYTFTVGVGGFHTIECGPDTSNPPYVSDTYLYQFNGNTYTGQAIMNQDDDGGGGFGTFPQSKIVVNLSPGDYLIATTSFGAGQVGAVRTRVRAGIF